MSQKAAKTSLGRGRWVIRSVAVTAAAWAITELLKPLWMTIPDDPIEFAQMTPLANAGAYLGASAAVVAMAGFAVSGLLLIVWEYRTIRTANTLGVATDLAPVEAVVWWFVPLLNLWKPYAVVKALGAALAPEMKRTITVWWAAYLLTLAFIYLTDAGRAVAEVARFGGGAMVIVAATSLIRIVRGVQGGLEAVAARVEQGPVAERVAR